MADFERLVEIGEQRLASGDPTGALNCLMGALRQDSNNWRALFACGKILHARGLLDVAVGYYRRAHKLNRSDQDILLWWARAEQLLEHFDTAADLLFMATTDDTPVRADICHAGALAYHAMGKEEALEEYAWALDVVEKGTIEEVKIKWDRSLFLLSQGRYPEGWRDHDMRFHWVDGHAWIPRIPYQMWDGDTSIEGKAIWVYSDQGLGDCIQNLRFIPELLRRGAIVTLSVDAPLYRLAKNDINMPFSGPGVNLLVRDQTTTLAELHCPMASLPGRLGVTLESLKGAAYLSYPKEPSGPLLARTEPQEGIVETTLTAGIVWGGSESNHTDASRSCPLVKMVPLFTDPRVQWFSFQQSPREQELQLLGLNGLVTSIGPLCRDMAETAAYLRYMNVVVTVDTAIAHLCGALGQQCFLMLAYNPDWRWGRTESRTPWYDSVTIFRQEEPNAWEGVVEKVKAAIVDLCC